MTTLSSSLKAGQGRLPSAWNSSSLLSLMLFGLAVVLAEWSPWLGLPMAWVSWRLKSRPWWPGMIAMAPWLAVGMATLQTRAELSVGLYLLVLVFMSLVFGCHFISRVPLFPSPHWVPDFVARRLVGQQRLQVMDLGSGWGGAASDLARGAPNAQVMGVEQALLPWLWSRLFAQGRSSGQMSRLTFRWGRFEKQSWDQADLVYVFLSPAAMPGLMARAEQRLKPGAGLLSVSFTDATRMGIARSRGTVHPDHPDGPVLYFWRQTPDGLVAADQELAEAMQAELTQAGDKPTAMRLKAECGRMTQGRTR